MRTSLGLELCWGQSSYRASVGCSLLSCSLKGSGPSSYGGKVTFLPPVLAQLCDYCDVHGEAVPEAPLLDSFPLPQSCPAL